MEFAIQAEVVYVDENGNKTYTYIKDINDVDKTYQIHHDNLWVKEETLSRNPHSGFVNPPKEVKEAIENYFIDFNMDMMLFRLKQDIEDEEISIEKLGTDIIITYKPINLQQFESKDQIRAKLTKLIDGYQFNFLRKIKLKANILLVFPMTSQEFLTTIDMG